MQKQEVIFAIDDAVTNLGINTNALRTLNELTTTDVLKMPDNMDMLSVTSEAIVDNLNKVRDNLHALLKQLKSEQDS